MPNLNNYELMDLEEALKAELELHLEEILMRLNYSGKLEELFELLGLADLLPYDEEIMVNQNGKVLVVGYSDSTEEQLKSILKHIGLDKNRFQFLLDYEAAKKYNFRNLQWDDSYCAVLVGAMPHSGITKGDYSSVITALENEDGYPPIVRVGTKGLKITKSSFKNTLMEMKSQKRIA